MVEKTYQRPIKKTNMAELFPLIAPIIEEGGTVRITVTGYSMYPLVSSRRDSVVLGKADCIRLGDVPLFQRADGSFILHRIVGEKDGAYYTMGDYETKKEYPVYPHQIVAKAQGFYRKGTFWDCSGFRYKAYSLFWRKTAFMRPLLLKTMAILAAKKTLRKRKKSC